MLAKVSIHLEDETVINMYAPNSRETKYMKQRFTMWKEEITPQTVETKAILSN
jgi:hypothetical protein